MTTLERQQLKKAKANYNRQSAEQKSEQGDNVIRAIIKSDLPKFGSLKIQGINII